MCGICGFTGPPRPLLLDRMLESLAHRGPDDVGTHVSDGVSIGARRLAIIDVAGGRQPVTNEDGTIAAALNGEIYNLRELRAMLERRGHRFRSAVDTELIPHLYEEFGPRFVNLVRGMFAIAVWDDRRRRLVLARDRAGEKPLLYASTRAGLVFASELKALLLDPNVPRTVDEAALHHYLTLQYVPGPGTLVTGVHRLAPGHLLVADEGRYRVERYWDIVPGTEAHSRSREGTVAELRERLEDAVGIQMHADVPVGALLSGGIDSAGIAALMTRAGGGAPPRTFTVGFEETAYDEREPARVVARALGTDHTELIVGPPTIDDLHTLVWHLDEPVADQAALPTFLIARVAAEHVKVVLTGEGSDELFGGYPRYRWFERALRLERVPAPIGAAAGALLQRAGRDREAHLLLGSQTPLDRHVAWTEIFAPASVAAILAPDVAAGAHRALLEHFDRLLTEWAGRPGVEQMMYLDFKTWLPDNILTKADRMTMAASLEARAPYLDQRVIEFAGTVPAARRLRGRETKPLLRAALAGLLPPAAIARRKASFRVPVDEWLADRLWDGVREVLLDRGAATASIVRRDELEALLAERAGPQWGRRVWTLLVLELWLRNLAATRAVTEGAGAG